MSGGIRVWATDPRVIDRVVADVVMPPLTGPAAVRRLLDEDRRAAA